MWRRILKILNINKKVDKNAILLSFIRDNNNLV